MLEPLGQQALQGFHFNQRHIAVQHQHGVSGQRRDGLGDGMAGAQLLVLQDEVEVVCCQAFTDQLGTMADDHMNTLRLELARAVDNMAEHGIAGNRVQHFRQCRTHASALACGENNDIE